jgi:cysteine desulfurase
MLRRIYLDNSATTPVDPRVVETMLPYLTGKFGNASSIHFFGQETRAAVDRARHQIADMIRSRPNEIIFTSGGTESNNLAIRGLLEANARYGKHIITSQIEHPAVTNVCERLEGIGYEVTYLPVYEEGRVRIDDVREALRGDTVLITVMTVNNEIGTIQPVGDIGELVRELRKEGKKIWFHTDAVQAAGKIDKIYAPKGIGALYIRRGVRLQSQNIGGHQERERRGGTEPVALIAAFGRAAELVCEELDQNTARLRHVRDRMESAIGERVSDIVMNGDRDHRVAHISNISFRGIEGEGLLINLDMQGIAVSTGSACSSGTLEPSPVIRALGRNDELARGAIRFSFGKDNSESDVDQLLEILPRAVENLRKLNPARPAAA